MPTMMLTRHAQFIRERQYLNNNTAKQSNWCVNTATSQFPFLDAAVDIVVCRADISLSDMEPKVSNFEQL
jgi:hypothetical protein